MRLTLAYPRIDWRCTLAGLILPASMLLALAANLVLSGVVGNLEEQGPVPFLVCSFIVLGAGGAVWGRTLAQLAQAQSIRRIALASAFSYSAVMVLTVMVLGRLEEHFVENGPSPLPLHYLYTVLFVPATFLGVALMGSAIGLALRHWALAGRLAWQGGLAAALTYFVCNVLQDVLGRRVGGPNAADTATMITVTLVCYIGAAMTMSTTFGKLLAQPRFARL